MLFILIGTIILTSTIYVIDRNNVDAINLDNNHSLNAESRTIQIV